MGTFPENDDAVDDLTTSEDVRDFGIEIGSTGSDMEAAFEADSVGDAVDDEVGELVLRVIGEVVVETMFHAMALIVGVNHRFVRNRVLFRHGGKGKKRLRPGGVLRDHVTTPFAHD